MKRAVAALLLALGVCGCSASGPSGPSSAASSAPITPPAPSLATTSPATAGQHVTMPKDNASPQDVVRAYVAAIDAKDCLTAEKLAKDYGVWCGRTTITNLRFTGSMDQNSALVKGRKAKQLSVRFTTHGGDETMPDGVHDWGYLLDRTGPHGAWRIYDQGVA